MKTKRMVLALVIILLVSMSAQAFAASNPFSDVPADHWAYDSVIQLAAVGLVEGYPDGTYGGTRTMTRYEAAMVWARMLARLEALVEAGVVENTAGVKEQITKDVLAEVNKAKSEIAALVTGLELPTAQVVEVQPVERPFVMTEEAEQVIAALVAELAEGYLAEAVELAKKTVQETALVERVVVEEKEVDQEVLAAIVEEVLAASLVEVTNRTTALELQVASDKNYVTMITTRINDRLGRVTRDLDVLEAQYAETATDVELVNGLVAALQGDVAALQKALDAKTADLANQIVAVSNEFANELNLLGVRVGELEMLYANLDSRVSELETAVTTVDSKLAAHEADYAAFKAETERVKLTGDLKVETSFTRLDDGENSIVGKVDAIFDSYEAKNSAYATKSNLGLTAQVSDETTVNLRLGANGGFAGALNNLELYQLEVVSSSLINRFVLGTMDNKALKKDIANRFNSYVLADGRDEGALADLSLGKLGVSVLASKDADDSVVALSSRYAIWPALGLELTYAALLDNNFAPADQSAVAVGLFGKVFGVDYDATVAYDRYAETTEKNLLVDVEVGTSLGALDVDAHYTMVGENFGKDSDLTGKGVYVADTKTRFGLDVAAELFGLDLAAGTYLEKDAAGADNVKSTMVEAGYDFTLLLPFSVSGRYGWNMEDVAHGQVKVGLSGLNLFGIKAGTSYTFVDNHISGDWRNPAKWTTVDAHIVDATVGYATDLKGASLDLGYDFELVIPRAETKDEFSNKLTHEFKAGYGFAEDMKLNLSAKKVGFQDAADEQVNVKEVTAGVAFSF